jgi:hypothetical protein
MRSIYDVHDGDMVHEWYDVPDSPFLLRVSSRYADIKVYCVFREVPANFGAATPYRAAQGFKYTKKIMIELTQKLYERFVYQPMNARMLREIGAYLQHEAMSELAAYEWEDHKAEWLELKRRVDAAEGMDDDYFHAAKQYMMYSNVYEIPASAKMQIMHPPIVPQPKPKPVEPVYYWHYAHAGAVLHALQNPPDYWKGSSMSAACGLTALFTNVMRGITPRRCPACCQATNTPQGTGKP